MATHALHRPHIRTQPESLPQCYDRRTIPFRRDRGRGHGAEERSVAFGAERVDRLVGQRDARFAEGVEAGRERREGEAEVERGGERFEDAPARGDDFAADAVAGDEAWGLFVREPLYFFWRQGGLK